MSEGQVRGEQVWCPRCNEYVQLIKVANAAKLLQVDKRTIYRYIEQGLVYSIKTVGSTYRVCSNCLFGPESVSSNTLSK